MLGANDLPSVHAGALCYDDGYSSPIKDILGDV